MSVGYLYLIHVREFINSGEPIYKFGRSFDVFSRLKQYPKGSKCLFHVVVDDHVKAETDVIRLLSTQFVNRKDVGKEYFEGHYPSMVSEIVSYVLKNDPPPCELKPCFDACDRTPMDNSFVLKKFVDTHRRVLSNARIETKRLQGMFQKWAREAGYDQSIAVFNCMRLQKDMHAFYEANCNQPGIVAFPMMHKELELAVKDEVQVDIEPEPESKPVIPVIPRVFLKALCKHRAEAFLNARCMQSDDVLVSSVLLFEAFSKWSKSTPWDKMYADFVASVNVNITHSDFVVAVKELGFSKESRNVGERRLVVFVGLDLY